MRFSDEQSTVGINKNIENVIKICREIFPPITRQNLLMIHGSSTETAENLL